MVVDVVSARGRWPRAHERWWCEGGDSTPTSDVGPIAARKRPENGFERNLNADLVVVAVIEFPWLTRGVRGQPTPASLLHRHTFTVFDINQHTGSVCALPSAHLSRLPSSHECSLAFLLPPASRLLFCFCLGNPGMVDATPPQVAEARRPADSAAAPLPAAQPTVAAADVVEPPPQGAAASATCLPTTVGVAGAAPAVGSGGSADAPVAPVGGGAAGSTLEETLAGLEGPPTGPASSTRLPMASVRAGGARVQPAARVAVAVSAPAVVPVPAAGGGSPAAATLPVATSSAHATAAATPSTAPAAVAAATAAGGVARPLPPPRGGHSRRGRLAAT